MTVAIPVMWQNPIRLQNSFKIKKFWIFVNFPIRNVACIYITLRFYTMKMVKPLVLLVVHSFITEVIL